MHLGNRLNRAAALVSSLTVLGGAGAATAQEQAGSETGSSSETSRVIDVEADSLNKLGPFSDLFNQSRGPYWDGYITVRTSMERLKPENLENIEQLGREDINVSRMPTFEIELGLNDAFLCDRWAFRNAIEVENTQGNSITNFGDRAGRLEELNLGCTTGVLGGETTIKFGVLPRGGYYTPFNIRPYGRPLGLLDEALYVLSPRGHIGLDVLHKRGFSEQFATTGRQKYETEFQLTMSRASQWANQTWGANQPSLQRTITDNLQSDLGHTWEPSWRLRAEFTRNFSGGSFFRFGAIGSSLEKGHGQDQTAQLKAELNRIIREDPAQVRGFIFDNAAEVIPIAMKEDIVLDLMAEDAPDILALYEAAEKVKPGSGDAALIANKGMVADFLTATQKRLNVIAQVADRNSEVQGILLAGLPIADKVLMTQYSASGYMHWHWEDMVFGFDTDIIAEGGYIWNITGEKDLNAPVAVLAAVVSRDIPVPEIPVMPWWGVNLPERTLGFHMEAGTNIDPRGFVSGSFGGGLLVPLAYGLSLSGSAAYDQYFVGDVRGPGYSWQVDAKWHVEWDQDGFYLGGKKPKRPGIQPRRAANDDGTELSSISRDEVQSRFQRHMNYKRSDMPPGPSARPTFQ